MKSFYKNSCRIENKVFILYVLDHELVAAFNLKINPNCFELSTFEMEHLWNPHE